MNTTPMTWTWATEALLTGPEEIALLIAECPECGATGYHREDCPVEEDWDEN